MGASALLLASAAKSERSRGGSLSASLVCSVNNFVSTYANVNLPATARSFAALKDANEVKCFFFRQSINRDSTGWAGSNDSDSFY
jgi:hypothetical protein